MRSERGALDRSKCGDQHALSILSLDTAIVWWFIHIHMHTRFQCSAVHHPTQAFVLLLIVYLLEVRLKCFLVLLLVEFGRNCLGGNRVDLFFEGCEYCRGRLCPES